MYKNQLQELAQRSGFNLPCYTCIREGPDHAPRFKATVSFNGEVFESPGYYTTLRQAEHAAAEVALTTLSQRGPTQSIATKILDDTGVCKNLLQETAQRAGVSLPVYNTIRTGPRHQPLYKCIVEIGGRHFKGETATTKKQAEKNAATAAWSALNQLPPAASHPTLGVQRPELGESGDPPMLSAMDGRSSYQPSSSHSHFGGRPRMPIMVRDRNSMGKSQSARVGQFLPPGSAESSHANKSNWKSLNQVPVGLSSKPTLECLPRFTGSKHHMGLPLAEGNFDSASFVQRGGMYQSHSSAKSSSRRHGRRHQRRHSLSGMESPVLLRDAATASRASAGGTIQGRSMLYSQPEQIRGLPYQSQSERFELKRSSFFEELQPKEEEDDWFYQEQASSLAHRSSRSSSLTPCQGNHLMHIPLRSESERFEGKIRHLLPLTQVHSRDEDEWHCINPQDAGTIHGKGKTPDFLYGPRDGRIIDRPMVNMDIRCNNQRDDGWGRGSLLEQGLDAGRGPRYREAWVRPSGSQQCLKERGLDPPLMQDHGYNPSYLEGWSNKDSLGGAVELDWPQSEEQMRSKALSLSNQSVRLANSTPSTSFTSPKGWSNKDSLGGAVELDWAQSEEQMRSKALSMSNQSVRMANSTPSTSFASPISSLWSKSTQWWGSRMPSSSATAASVSSALGLHPPHTAAPAVKVRQMVPVCSAPPRRLDAVGWNHQLQSNETDNLTESCKALSNLRI